MCTKVIMAYRYVGVGKNSSWDEARAFSASIFREEVLPIMSRSFSGDTAISFFRGPLLERYLNDVDTISNAVEIVGVDIMAFSLPENAGLAQILSRTRNIMSQLNKIFVVISANDIGSGVAMVVKMNLSKPAKSLVHFVIIDCPRSLIQKAYLELERCVRGFGYIPDRITFINIDPGKLPITQTTNAGRSYRQRLEEEDEAKELLYFASMSIRHSILTAEDTIHIKDMFATSSCLIS
jgi:hypothetical protein